MGESGGRWSSERKRMNYEQWSRKDEPWKKEEEG